MQTERVTFLTSPDQKAKLDAYAALKGQSVGQVLREASSRYIAEETDEISAGQEAELAALVAEVNAAMPKMSEALDDMIRTLDETHQHVDRTLRAAGIRK